MLLVLFSHKMVKICPKKSWNEFQLSWCPLSLGNLSSVFFLVFSQFCYVAHSSYHPQEELVNSRSTVNSSCNPTHKSKTTMVSQVWKSNPIGKCPLSTHHPSSHGVLVAVGSFAGKFTSIVTSHWVRTSPKVLSMCPCKIIFHIQIIVLFTFLEPRPYYWNSDSK
jgi:hypothetical protein